ncbi:MAG: hypothetical protein J5626_04425 [Lachnospiraceae bacterium]|nr:hypothetical protein [Lachnospiraceae bacterium]
MAVTLHIVINGGTPFGIGEEKVGPFLLYQFMAVYVINLIIIIIETKALAYKHLLLPTATTYLAILYGEMLYNIESAEGTAKALALTAIVVLAEFAISYIIVTAVGRMRKQ